MIEFIIKWAGVLVCIVVIGACICRTDQMKAGRNGVSWYLMYVCMALFALGTLIDLLTERSVDWYTAAGIAGILAHMLLSRDRWRYGPPSETKPWGRT